MVIENVCSTKSETVPTEHNETTAEQSGLQALAEKRQREGVREGVKLMSQVVRQIFPGRWADHSISSVLDRGSCRWLFRE